MLPSQRINQLQASLNLHRGSSTLAEDTIQEKLDSIVSYMDEQYVLKHKGKQITNPSMSLEDKILALLKKHQVLTHTQILQHCWRMGKAVAIHQALLKLEVSGDISKFKPQGANSYAYSLV